MRKQFIIIAGMLLCMHVQAKERDTSDLMSRPKRVYNTMRLTTPKPTIDGVLDDPCWKTGEWAGNYTQWTPNEGAKPSQPTEMKILYDDKNIYVAIRAYDSEPEKIIKKAGRRDDFAGDIVGICFDSYHDHRTGFEFDVMASGQKIDLVLTNPTNTDLSWNAVWYAKVGMEDSAWVVEYEIPLSQLRYSSDYEQVWGLHCWRSIDRLQEESDWEPQSSQGPGALYLFGELHGIKGLPKSRRIEIMPYGLGKMKTFKKEAGNPFADKGYEFAGNAGLDAKIGLSSNFTADVTINPDFGQVESDPSEMNLSAFETYYSEKRPFFLEGKNIFDFTFDDNYLFYSRRIGHTPVYYPELKANEYMKYPDYTTILEAVKVSGKSSDGLSVGVLQSLTANEEAKIQSDTEKKRTTIEPLTNLAVVRVQQDFKQGNTMVGGMITSTNRFINDSQLNFLNREAYTGGVDLLHQWHDKEYYVESKLIGSCIKGDQEALTQLQASSARYYNRPDAYYLHFDSTRTQLGGHGGYLKIGKGSKGLWRYSTEVNWRSPGLDLNDIGYMQTADIIKQKNSLYYFINQPVGIFRTYNIGLYEHNVWDFGGRYLWSGGQLSVYLEFLNKWAISNSTYYYSENLDTRVLRGGEAMIMPYIFENYLYFKTDGTRRIFFDCTLGNKFSGNDSKHTWSLQPGLTLTPINTLKFSFSTYYEENTNKLQYVDTKTVEGTNHYILGKIDQHTLGLTFRIDYNITPELSIQYYGSPYASVGKYSEFKTVTNPKASKFSDRLAPINVSASGNDYNVTGENYSFANPNFDFHQFRSNLVFKWEYRPGSQLYLVWSQDRTQYEQPGYDSVNQSIKGIGEVYPNNIFLIKLNYWFSL